MAAMRIGRFNLPEHIYVDDQKIAREIMASLTFVLRCEHMAWLGVFEYVAISDAFELVERGHMPPWYSIELTAAETKGSRDVRWKWIKSRPEDELPSSPLHV